MGDHGLGDAKQPATERCDYETALVVARHAPTWQRQPYVWVDPWRGGAELARTCCAVRHPETARFVFSKTLDPCASPLDEVERALVTAIEATLRADPDAAHVVLVDAGRLLTVVPVLARQPRPDDAVEAKEPLARRGSCLADLR